jgi:hypothetical protein
MKAQELGLARNMHSRERYLEMATRRILESQHSLQVLMREGLVTALPLEASEKE